MSEVKRFIDINDSMEQFSEGIWVKYEDYAELKAQRDALAADREKFAAQCAVAKIAVQYAQAAGFECTLNTPEVDAYLNSVRAESLESFAHQQRVIADALPGHEAQRSHRITACRAEDFAKQLRAGEPS